MGVKNSIQSLFGCIISSVTLLGRKIVTVKHIYIYYIYIYKTRMRKDSKKKKSEQ